MIYNLDATRYWVESHEKEWKEREEQIELKINLKLLKKKQGKLLLDGPYEH